MADSVPGATLVCLDVPQGSEFAINFSVHTTGPRFSGVKMLPPGLHFVATRAVGTMGDLAPRTGFFVELSGEEVKSWRWIPDLEELRPVDEDDSERIAAGVARKELDGRLAPYEMASHRRWQYLTSCLEGDVVQRTARHFSNAGSRLQLAQTTKFSGAGDDGTGPLHTGFTELEAYLTPKGLSGEALTRAVFDRSDTVEEIIRDVYPTSPKGIIGEMQAAFVLFIVGESYAGLEQWKPLVALLCNCPRLACEEKNPLLTHFIATLRRQLKQLPADLFHDVLSQKNFLDKSLKSLLIIADQYPVTPAVQRECQRLTRAVKKHFDVSFVERGVAGLQLDDEDAPVIVETDDT